MNGLKIKQSIKLICCLVFASTVVFLMLFANYLGVAPSITDVIRTVPVIHRVLPVTDRSTQHFPQHVVYQHMAYFDLENDTITSVSDHPLIFLPTNPKYSGRFLSVYISELNVTQTNARIYYVFEGEVGVDDNNSVRFMLESGQNLVYLSRSGFVILRLDLADESDISMIIYEVVSSNYITLPASLWVSFAAIALLLAIALYLCFFKWDLLVRIFNRLKGKFLASFLYRVGISSEKNRYIIAAIFVSLMMALTYLAIPIRYYNVDEAVNMYIVAGYHTGTPAPMFLFSNILFGYLLSGLYTVIPLLPWYGIMHIVFLFISQVMILKSFLKAAAQKNLAVFVPISLYSILYVFFLLFSTTLLQFTTTPAILGAAACVVAATLFYGESKKAHIFDIFAIVILVLFSFIIRWATGDGVLRFFVVVLIFKAFLAIANKVDIRQKLLPIRSYIIIGVCVAATVTFARQFDGHLAHSNGMRLFREWNAPWATHFNYPHSSFDESPELYESIGWDRDLAELVVPHSFLMDERVSADSFVVLNEYQRVRLLSIPFYVRLESAIDMIITFLRETPVAGSSANVLLIAFTVHFIMLIKQFCSDKPGRINHALQILFSLAIFGGFLASLLWLGLGGLSLYAVGGRISLRAFLVPLFPTACLLFWHILHTWAPSLQRCAKKCLPIALIACFIIGFYFANVPFHSIQAMATSPQWQLQVERRLNREQFAIDNPDSVFIFNTALITSTPVPVFTVYGDQRPTNLLPWGLSMSCPTLMEQRRINGLYDFGANNLLRPNFYVMDRSTDSVFTRYMQNRYNAFNLVTEHFDDVFVMRFVRLDSFLTGIDNFEILYQSDAIGVNLETLGITRNYTDYIYREYGYDECIVPAVSVYSGQLTLNSYTNYLFTFSVETNESPCSFWVEWYTISPELHFTRQFIRQFEVEPGYNNYFGVIYTEGKELEDARFRIIAAPNADMVITDFTIMEVCLDEG
ncbi:MAG: hypothetical protein FWC75_02445 [Oscillospiraceae bacterium]|nr:hypothetical protein [Oscillospiraceae bacterium]